MDSPLFRWMLPPVAAVGLLIPTATIAPHGSGLMPAQGALCHGPGATVSILFFVSDLSRTIFLALSTLGCRPYATLGISQRESARPRTRCEVEHSLQRRLCQPVRVRRRRRAQPSAVLATACWTAIASRPHQRLDHPAAAADSGRGPARGPARSVPPRHSSARRLRIPARGSVGVQLGAVLGKWRVRGVGPCGAQTRPSVSAAPGFGWPVRVSGETRIASQPSAPQRGVAPYTTRSKRQPSSFNLLRSVRRGGAQLAANTTMVSCLHSAGQPRRHQRRT